MFALLIIDAFVYFSIIALIFHEHKHAHVFSSQLFMVESSNCGLQVVSLDRRWDEDFQPDWRLSCFTGGRRRWSVSLLPAQKPL